MSDVVDFVDQSEAESEANDMVNDEEVQQFDLPEKMVAEIALYCNEQREKWLSETSSKRESRAKWRRQRMAMPKQKVKNTPWPKASNVSPPLTRIQGNTFFGKMYDAYATKKPLVSVEALYDNEDLKAKAQVVADYMNMLAESKTDLNVRKKLRDLLQEVAFMDLTVIKVAWSDVRWNLYGGKAAEPGKSNEYVKHLGPEWVVIKGDDFGWRTQWDDIQTMPVCWQELHLSWKEVEERFRQGKYKGDPEELKSFGMPMDVSPSEQMEDEIANTQTEYEDRYDIQEFYVFWDVQGNGSLTDVMVTVHMDSMTVLNVEFTGIGARLMQQFALFERPGRLDGAGVAQVCEYLQDEVDTIHNARNDSMMVANQRVVVSKRNSGLNEDMPLHPGMNIRVADPANDIKSFQLGEVYPSSAEAESITLLYAQKTTSISDVMSGFSDQMLKSRDTGVGMQTRAQMGSGVIGAVMAGVDDSLSMVWLYTFYQLVAHKDEVIENETRIGRMPTDKIQLLREALDIEPNEVATKLKFKVDSTDVEKTFDVQRQSLVTLTQLLAQYATQTMPLAEQVLGPQGQQIQQTAPELYQFMMSILVVATKMTSKIMDFFDQKDVGDDLPDLAMQERAIDMIREMKQAMLNQQLSMQKAQGALGALGGMGGEQLAGGQTGIGQAMPGQPQVQPQAQVQQQVPEAAAPGGFAAPVGINKVGG